MTVVLFVIDLITLHLLAKRSSQMIWTTFHKVTGSTLGSNIFLSLLFFPGTVLHEIAHFSFCILLMLPVKEVKVLPEFHHNQIKLGSVSYIKKGIFRPVIVGIAPLFFGLGFLWYIVRFQYFPSPSLIQTISFSYLIFAISSTMFSSKQDLVDFAYAIPLAIIVGGILYVFNISLDVSFLSEINQYLLISIYIHLGIIIGVYLLERLINKRQ